MRYRTQPAHTAGYGGLTISTPTLHRLSHTSLIAVFALFGLLAIGMLHRLASNGACFCSTSTWYASFDGLEVGIHRGSHSWGCGYRQFEPGHRYIRIRVYGWVLGAIVVLFAIHRSAKYYLDCRTVTRAQVSAPPPPPPPE